jgi:hypothetical protein
MFLGLLIVHDVLKWQLRVSLYAIGLAYNDTCRLMRLLNMGESLCCYLKVLGEKPKALLLDKEATCFAKAACIRRGKRFRMTNCSCERFMMVGAFRTMQCCLHYANTAVVPGADTLHGQNETYPYLTV